MLTVYDHMISVPTWRQALELLWLLGLAWYGFRLYKKSSWFQEPVGGQAMFWELPIAAVLTAFLTTDFQLEGLFVIMKYHYFKEWAKQDKVFGVTVVLFLSLILFLLILSPFIGV